MSIATRQQSIYAEVEAAYNTAETIVGADYIEVENLNPNPAENVRIIERLILQSSLAQSIHQYGGSLFGFQFDAELKGSGTAGTAPRIGDLLRACGLAETIVASTSVTYAPSSDFANHESVTILYQEGGNQRIVRGCRGNCALKLDAGQRLISSFTFVGHIESEGVASAPTPSIEATLPPTFRSADVQADSDVIQVGSIAVDLGNTVSISPDPNSADSYGAIRVTARKVAGSVDPEAETISTKDFIGELRAVTGFAMQTGVLGSTAGNRVAISMPNCAWTGAGYGDREALLVHDMPFTAYPSSGDDDIAIQFT